MKEEISDLLINVYTNTNLGVFAVDRFVSHTGTNDDRFAG